MPPVIRHHQSLGDTLYELRLARNLTQTELARRAEIHPTMVSRYEQNKATPSQGTLERLLTVFGASTALRTTILM